MPSTNTVLHGLAAAHFWFGCFYDWNFVNVPADVHPMGRMFGRSGKLKFLTFWDALLQATFFTVCFLSDLLGDEGSKEKPLITRLKDGMLTCLAFPLSMFVGITFWALYAVDRELVFPKVLDAYFPCWLNHVMHTNIMIFILIELSTSFRRYPPRKFGISVLTGFMLVYLIWVHIIHAYTGFWVYPVLEVLNFPLRIVFFLSLLGLAVALYVMGEKLNGAIWAKRLKSQKAKVN